MDDTRGTLEDFAQAQGWDLEAQLELALDYIENQQQPDAWLDHLRQAADAENEA